MKRFLYRIVLMILEELLPEIVKLVLEEIKRKNEEMSPTTRSSEIVQCSVNKVLGGKFPELVAREQVLRASDRAFEAYKTKLS